MQPSTTSGAVAKPNSSGAEHGADDDVSPRLDLAVDLNGDAVAQPVDDERLLRFGESELPGAPRVLHRRERARARAAVVARNHDVVGLGLRHARRDRAHKVTPREPPNLFVWRNRRNP